MHNNTHVGARALPRTNAHQHTHTYVRARSCAQTHVHVGTHTHTHVSARTQTNKQQQKQHTPRGKEKTGYSTAGEGVTKRAASGPFGTFCHHVVTKRVGVTKRAGCASNLIKRAVVTKRAATGNPNFFIPGTPPRGDRWEEKLEDAILNVGLHHAPNGSET